MAKAHAVKSVSFGGSQVTSIQNASFSATPDATITLRGDNELYPTLVSTRGMVPTLNFQTTDLSYSSTLTEGTSGAVQFVIEEVATGTGAVGGGDITGSATTGVVTSANTAYDIDGNSTLDVVIIVESADGTDPITWS